jgi:putative ABC transport system permease protein
MEGILSVSISQQQFSMLLLTIFAAVALTLAAVGIYGVISFSVNQRTREMGIRMALGARPLDLLKLILGHGMKLMLAGVSIGLIVSLVLTRLMKSLLYSISATDPTTYIVISILLTAVALLACYIPARKLIKIEAATALRYE